jgi:hypothetical protein
MTQAADILREPASEQRLVLLSKELEDATNLFLAKMRELEKLLDSIEE